MLSLGWLDRAVSMGGEFEWLLVAFAIFAAACGVGLLARRWATRPRRLSGASAT